MPGNESDLPRRSAPDSGKPAAEKWNLGEVKVHVTPKGGRYVDPDDLFENPLLKKILGLENPDPQPVGDTHDHELNP